MNNFRILRGVQLWQISVLAITILTAAIAGMFVALAGMQSPEGVYRAAILPLVFLGFSLFIYLLDQGDQSGPVLVLIAAYFLPLQLSTGTGSPIVDSLALTSALVVVWVVRKIILKQRRGLFPSAVNLPLLGFVSVTAASLLWSTFARDPYVYVWDSFLLVQVASTLVMVMLPLASLLAANQIEKRKQLVWMAGLTIALGIAGFIADITRISLPFNTGGLISMWIITISASIAIFQRNLNWVLRLVLFSLAGWWIYRSFGLNLQWVAGWFPGFIAIGVLSFMRSWRTLVLVLLVLIVLVSPNLDYYLQTFLPQESATSLETREDAWRVNWEITKDHFLLGTGPAGYTVYYMTYFPSRAMATHNNFIDIIAQTGVLGLGFLLWMFVAMIRIGVRVHRRLRRSGSFELAFVNASLAGLVGSIVIMMFGDWLFPFAYTQTIAGFDYIVPSWLFFGALLAVERMTRTATSSTPGDLAPQAPPLPESL